MKLELSGKAIEQLEELQTTIGTSVKKIDHLLTDLNNRFYKSKDQLGPHQEDIDQILKKYSQYFEKDIQKEAIVLITRINDTKERVENLVKKGLLP